MQPEPWLRGNIVGLEPGFHPVLAHLLRASQHIREDVETACNHLTREQVWCRPEMLNPVGFHLKHLAGSSLRLLTYLKGGRLSARQLAAIPLEKAGEEDAATLIASVNVAFDLYDTCIRGMEPERFAELREVGRDRIPVTAISLAIHITEHGHRHTGQIVSAAALARVEQSV